MCTTADSLEECGQSYPYLSIELYGYERNYKINDNTI